MHLTELGNDSLDREREDSLESLNGREIDSLLEGSGFSGPYYKWRVAREVFNRHISAGQKVLDVGCGNGFLLSCLLKWRSDEFEPFGFDINAALIADAKRILPRFSQNFVVHDMFVQPWPVEEAHVVRAPWIDDVSYIESCLRSAGSIVVFSLYDEAVSRHELIVPRCRELGLDVLAIDHVPAVTMVVAVAGRAQSSSRPSGLAMQT